MLERRSREPGEFEVGGRPFGARVTRLHLARVERPGPPGPGSRLEGEVFDVGR